MNKLRDTRWIHLSDLHIGLSENQWVNDTLQKELVYFINNDIGRVDFILVTGDIIHQGQYDKKRTVDITRGFFEKVKEITPNIVFCAGNHDYKRSLERYRILRDWEIETNKKSKAEVYASKLRPDFAEYVEICKELTSKDNPICEHTYIYEINNINIIVLNTSVFSGQPILNDRNEIFDKRVDEIEVDDTYKIWVTENDLPSVGGIARENPTIIIGHHPLEMFNPICRKYMEEFIHTLNAQYLCGHIHKNIQTNIHGMIENISAGLFQDNYNTPSFTYNILRSNRNEKIEKTLFIYEDFVWKQKINNTNYYNYKNLDEATPDIATDIYKSKFLYFYGLQASSLKPDSAYIGSAIKHNKNLDMKFLVANPYCSTVINRIQQIPDFENVMSKNFNIKWNDIKNVVSSKASYRINNNFVKIKYHEFPLVFRSIITDNSLYIGLYEDKDSSESKMYKFENNTDIYSTFKMHFEYAWGICSDKLPLVPPAKYRIFNENNDFFVTPSLVINVTDKCNMNCVYCPEGGENLCNGIGTCDVNAIKCLIRTFRSSINNYDDAVLRITGGEPFDKDACKKTIEILKEAKNNNYNKIVLCTNGSYLKEIFKQHENRKILESIKDNLLLKISIDSLNNNTFREITRVDLLEKIKSNINFAKNLGFKIELNVVATKFNIHEIMDLYKFSSKFKLIGIKVLTVNDFGGRVDLSKCVDESTNKELVRLVETLEKNPNFTNHFNVFLNDNKGVAMKKFEDQDGCMITIVDHNNSESSITPNRLFCKECYSCEYFPASDEVSTGLVKPCATGIMSLTMRQDGMLSFCRLQDTKNSIKDKKRAEDIENIVKNQLKHFQHCFIYRKDID